MKKLYFLLFFVFSFMTKAQIVNIPDANFKAALVNSNWQYGSIAKNINGNNMTIDTNGDGEIQVTEALQVYQFNITSVNSSNINSIEGVNSFSNLKKIYCDNISMSSVNIDGLLNLEELYIKYCGLTNYHIVNCPNLSIVNFNYNLLTSLDLSNLSQLTSLSCSNNNLITLNLNGFINLTYLNCSYNNINNLYLLDLTNLNGFDCNNNQITSLNLNDLQTLQSLDCSFNYLNNINFSGCHSLQNIYCNNNSLNSIDVNQCKSLSNLFCADNPNLESIYTKNGISENVNLNSNIDLKYVCCDDFEIYSLSQNISNYILNYEINTYCSLVPGGTYYEISGSNKLDLNYDGCDNMDIIYPNFQVIFTDGFSSEILIADTSGNYHIPVGTGSFTFVPINNNPDYFTISPTSFVVDFPTDASPFSQDFCVTANGVHSDVEVVIIPTTPARPGFDAHYRIIFKNIGNQVENGEVDFAYQEDVLDFISSSNIYDSQTIYGNTTTLSWNYSNLMPFETRIIHVVLNVNSPMETPAVNNGDVLGIFSEISTTNTDEDLSNNSSGLRQVVVGSYDPNDKTCVEGETVDVATVGKYVHYVIRFENTGTYPAQNIVVKDMIDASKFDISTLVPLHGSHEFFTRINDNKVEFIFENINLDFNDATNDGYVAFKIKTLPTLMVGDTFSNDANIYFDYNFPITTNEYVTTIDNLLNNQDFAFENEFVLYPNPTKDILNISTKNQTEIQSVEIYNIVGQIVIAIPNTTKTIDVSTLETGTYFVKVNTEKGSSTTKFVKE